MMMLADMGTKPHAPRYVKLFKYWAMGQQYYPNEGTEHYDLLQMKFYEKKFHEILKLLN